MVHRYCLIRFFLVRGPSRSAPVTLFSDRYINYLSVILISINIASTYTGGSTSYATTLRPFDTVPSSLVFALVPTGDLVFG